MSGTAVTSREQPLFVPAGDGWMFAVHNRPDPAVDRGIGALLVWGSDSAYGANQVFARLARQLADDGFHALRVDLRGNGQSSGGVRPVRLGALPVDDMQAACDEIRSSAGGRTVFIGHCSGARLATTAAANSSDVAALVLLGCPVYSLAGRVRVPNAVRGWSTRQLVKRLFRGRSYRRLLRRGALRGYTQIISTFVHSRFDKVAHRLSRSDGPKGPERRVRADPSFVQELEQLSAAGVPMLLLYGEDDEVYRRFLSAQDPPLSDVLAALPTATLRIEPGFVHSQRTVEAQQRVLDIVPSWIRANV